MNIQRSFDVLGLHVLYLQKWPLLWTEDYPWWKYINRPPVNEREMELLKLRLTRAEAISMMLLAYRTKVVYRERDVDGVTVSGVTYDYRNVKELEFAAGRYFTPAELQGAHRVAILGANVAKSLFEGRNNIEGEEVKVNGVRYKVIGVLKKEGDDLFGFTTDDNMIVPYGTMEFITDVKDQDPLIAITPKKGTTLDELEYEIKGVMRSIRKLKPGEEDNFAINRISVVTQGIKSLFSVIDAAGIITGLLSIVVGAFGIANIMFVAVKERTHIIGIKKAIGAQNSFILLEFLLEAVVLCLIGGIAGLILVAVLFQLLQYLVTHVWKSDFVFYITTTNILLGISISVVVGILSGFVPAWFAAKMRPVDAMRSN